MFTLLFQLVCFTLQWIWVKCILKTCKFLLKHWWVLPSIIVVIIVTLMVMLLIVLL